MTVVFHDALPVVVEVQVVLEFVQAERKLEKLVFLPLGSLRLFLLLLAGSFEELAKRKLEGMRLLYQWVGARPLDEGLQHPKYSRGGCTTARRFGYGHAVRTVH